MSTNRTAATVESTYPYTERGNAQRLVAEGFQGRVRYHAGRGQWMVYNGRQWVYDISGQVVRLAKALAAQLLNEVEGLPVRDPAFRHAIASNSDRGINATCSLAKTELGVIVTAAELDPDPWLLNCQNGTVNLRTGELKPHDPRDLCTRMVRANYDPHATAPTFEKFLNTTFASNGNLIRYVRKQAGLAASGDISVQEMPIAHGGGSNGKSVLFDLLLHILGGYAGVAPPNFLTVTAFDAHPTELADLEGLRLVVASETEEGDKLRVQRVKALTGDATVKARRMRADFYEYPRQFKIWVATNNKPRISENTEAVWRRLRLIPFTVTIPAEQRDPNLLEKLKAEADGILAWIVAGSLDRLANGMTPPPEVMAATDEYRAEEDLIGEWVESRLAFGPRSRMTRPEANESYRSWAAMAGDRHPLAAPQLYDRIRKLKGVEEAKWKTVTGETVRGFKGVGLQQIGVPE